MSTIVVRRKRIPLDVVSYTTSVITLFRDDATFNALGLPAQVTANLNNNTSILVSVTWSQGSFVDNTTGIYTLSGTPDLPTNISGADVSQVVSVFPNHGLSVAIMRTGCLFLEPVAQGLIQTPDGFINWPTGYSAEFYMANVQDNNTSFPSNDSFVFMASDSTAESGAGGGQLFVDFTIEYEAEFGNLIDYSQGCSGTAINFWAPFKYYFKDTQGNLSPAITGYGQLIDE